MKFKIFDKINIEIPTEINKIIFNYYNSKCKKCNTEQTKCQYCDIYSCPCYMKMFCCKCFRFQCPDKCNTYFMLCKCCKQYLCNLCHIEDGYVTA